MRRLVLMSVVLMGLTTSAAQTGESRAQAADRLRAAQAAEERLTLRGALNTVSFFAEGSVSSEVVVSRKPGKSRWEYRSPALKGLVILEKGETVIRLDAATKTAHVSRPPREPNRLDLLLKNYRVSYEKEESIVGRRADVIAIHPKQAGGPSKKVWVDRATGLILRSEYYNSERKLSTLTFYTDVDWNPSLSDDLFEAPAGWRQVALDDEAQRHWDKDALSREVGFTVREPSYRPAGYVLDGFHLYHFRCGVAAAHLRYVDGLNSVSVFARFTQCPRGHRGRGFQWGRRRQGRGDCELFDNRQGKMLVKRSGNLTFVLVGDLPQEELQKIADSIR